MNETRIKKIVFLSLLVFLLSVMVVALHRHTGAFWPAACSVCKVRASLSGTFSKVNINHAPAIAVLCFVSAAFCLSMCGILRGRKILSDRLHATSVYPNKASPFVL